jgi:hypothetical protein
MLRSKFSSLEIQSVVLNYCITVELGRTKLVNIVIATSSAWWDHRKSNLDSYLFTIIKFSMA